MSVVIRTIQCYPTEIIHCPVPFISLEPDHEHCPGGHHVPGVMGGWHCPCSCHQETP